MLVTSEPRKRQPSVEDRMPRDPLKGGLAWIIVLIIGYLIVVAVAAALSLFAWAATTTIGAAIILIGLIAMGLIGFRGYKNPFERD